MNGELDTLGRIEAAIGGIERVYQGVIKGGQVQLSNYGKVNRLARLSADSFLVRNKKLIVALPETRLTSVACSLLLAAKYDSATADYAAAWVAERIIQSRTSAVGQTSP
jgi:hypothetical protein